MVPASSQSIESFQVYPDSLVLHFGTEEVPDIQIYRGYYPHPDSIKGVSVYGKKMTSPGKLVFSPIVPFLKNNRYTLVNDMVLKYFSLAIPEKYDYLEVEQIFPLADRLPSNILKFHILFDQPVSTVEIYNHIHLQNAAGEEIEEAVLRLSTALLDTTEKLLTVWIDPGRQKRDLGPHQRLGPVFAKGNEYSLIVDTALRNKEGVPMNSSFTKTFIATEADRLSPQPDNWQLELPRENSTTPLLLIFDEPLDYKSVLNSIEIWKEENRILGISELLEMEVGLKFSPNLPWSKGEYEIVVTATLEDLSGNNLVRLFDQDLDNKSDDLIQESIYKIPFTIE